MKRKPAPVYALGFDIIGGKDVMPLGGWWGPFVAEEENPDSGYEKDFINDEYYKLISDAGVNVITVTPDLHRKNPDATFRNLELAQKYNMGFFVHDDFFTDEANLDKFAERAALFNKYKSCLGYHLGDEPGAKYFDLIHKVYKQFADKKIDGLLYTNMLPMYGEELFSGDKGVIWSYEQYIGEYLAKVPTKFLSYDFYPFYKADGGNENIPRYFKNLAVAKKLCDEHKIPLWTFVQAGGQWGQENKPSVDIYPSEGEFLFDVNANLAYGVKSIQYFTLIEPQEFSHTDQGSDFNRIGILGANGKKTSWYGMVQKANRHIHAIDHVLMNASCEGVIAVGETAQKNVTVDIPYTICKNVVGGKAHSDKYYELSGVTGNNVIIGCFNYRGATALYVVNYDVRKANSAVLHFDGEYRANVYRDGVRSECSGKDCVLEFGPGEGILLEIM